jgi:hypothetical protein
MTNPEPSPLLHALGRAARIFWCNTNRAYAPEVEQRMHARCFAAAWLPFRYEEHMREVRQGDVIFMYAKLLGVVAIGRAMESRLEILGCDHSDRLRDFASEGENEEEWRIPVEWLVWNESHPCPVEALHPTFVEITHHTDRVETVRAHFMAHW